MDHVEGSRGAREEILGRIRKALETQSPVASHQSPARNSNSDPEIKAQAAVPSMHRDHWQPATGDWRLLLPLFQSQCGANAMEAIATADAAATATALEQVIASLPPGEIFFQDAPELRGLAELIKTERALHWSSEGAPAESSQATVSLCEALVAASGSVLVSSAGCGGRGASVVAPCHIVVAHCNQLVPDFEAVMVRAREIAFDNSFVGLITGSSRTADIEKKLIIGAHGPGRLVVIVQAEG